MRCRSNKKCRPATLPDSACGAETFPHSTAGFWRRPAGFPLQVCKKRLTCNTRRSGRPICVAGRTKNADLKHFRTRPAAQRPSLTHHRDFGAGLPGFPLQVCKKRLTCNTRRSGRPICVAGRTKNADLQHFRTRPAAQRPSLTQHRDLASLRSPHPSPPAADGAFWRRAPLPRRGVEGEGNVRGGFIPHSPSGFGFAALATSLPACGGRRLLATSPSPEERGWG